jgi:hypothetical protein
MDCAELLWWIFELFKALVPVSVSIAALVVATNQRRINGQNLRLSLYKERIGSFQKLQNFLLKFGSGVEDVNSQDLMLFQDCIVAARFLFEDSAVRNFLDEARIRCSALRNCQSMQAATRLTRDSDDRRKRLGELFDEEQSHRQWLIEKVVQLESTFESELDVAKL